MKMYVQCVLVSSGIINTSMNTFNNTKAYFDTRIASYYLGISESTLKRLRSEGGGPVFYKFSRCIRYTIPDLKEWALQNQHRVCREYCI